MTIFSGIRNSILKAYHFVDEDLIHPIEHLAKKTYMYAKPIAQKAEKIGYNVGNAIYTRAKTNINDIYKFDKSLYDRSISFVSHAGKLADDTLVTVDRGLNYLPFALAGAAYIFLKK